MKQSLTHQPDYHQPNRILNQKTSILHLSYRIHPDLFGKLRSLLFSLG